LQGGVTLRDSLHHPARAKNPNHMAHRRRGIIAGLPKEIREQLNQQLEEGWKYKRISAWLADQGHEGITEKHISVWYHGGFEDWLKARERLEEMQGRSEPEEVAEEKTVDEPSTDEARHKGESPQEPGIGKQIIAGIPGYSELIRVNGGKNIGPKAKGLDEGLKTKEQPPGSWTR
jgi:hypothetical protein